MAGTSIIFDLVGRDRASDKFDKVGDSADKSGGKMAKFGKLAKLAALGLAAGVGAAAVGIFKLTQGAIEDSAAQAKLAKAMENAAGASKQQIAATEDWISAQGRALGVTDDELRPALQKLVGATGDVGKAQKLASLAMDVSAGSGKSMEAVSTALAKAQNGQVAGLSKLGISTKNAEGKTISFKEATRRLAELHKGQASEAANTTEGKFKRLKVILSETGEEIGAKVIPIVTKMADWFLKVGLPALTRFGDYLSTVLPPIFSKVKDVVSSVMSALKGDIGGKVSGIKAIFQDAISIITSLWSAFGPTIVSYVRTAFKNVKKILSGAFDVIRGIFKTVSALLKGDWKGVWDGIKLIVRGAVKILTGIVRQLWNVIKSTFRAAGVALREIFKGIWNGIKSAAKTGVGWVVEQVKAMPGRLTALGGRLLSAGKSLIGKLWEGIRGAAGNAGGFVSDLLGKIKSGINSLLDLPLKTPTLKVKGVTILGSTTVIPAFRRGGIAPGGLALVGEEGPELVDLPGGSRVTPHRASMARLAGGGGGAVIIVNVSTGVGDPVAIGKEIEKTLIQTSRALGRPLQFQAR